MLVCHCITACFVYGSMLVYRGLDCVCVVICFVLELYIDVMMVIKLLLVSYYYLHISFILGLFIDSHAHNRIIAIDITVIFLSYELWWHKYLGRALFFLLFTNTFYLLNLQKIVKKKTSVISLISLSCSTFGYELDDFMFMFLHPCMY